MIIDLNKFVTNERPYWAELESTLNRIENNSRRVLPLAEIRRFHYPVSYTHLTLPTILLV